MLFADLKFAAVRQYLSGGRRRPDFWAGVGSGALFLVIANCKHIAITHVSRDS